MPTPYDLLLDKSKNKLRKAVAHLEFSHCKIVNLSSDVKNLEDEQLEIWESYAARFGRVVDLFLMRLVKTFVLKGDPGFSGSLRDFVEAAAKAGIISNADRWMELREVRNKVAHEYEDAQLDLLYARLKSNFKFLTDEIRPLIKMDIQ